MKLNTLFTELLPFSVCMQAILLPILSLSTHAQRENTFSSPSLPVATYVVLDAATGKAIMKQDETKKHEIASLTKIFVLWTAKRMMQKYKVSEQQLVPISSRAARIPWSSNFHKERQRRKQAEKIDTFGPMIGRAQEIKSRERDAATSLGEKYLLQDLMKDMMNRSSNGAAMAIAEYFGEKIRPSPQDRRPAEDIFVEAVRNLVQKEGLKHTEIYEVTGLGAHDSSLPQQKRRRNNISSALDLAVAATRLYLEFPAIRDMTSQARYTSFFGTSIAEQAQNRNRLLDSKDQRFYQPGVDGVKTGFTKTAGHNLVTRYRSGDHHWMVALLGASPDHPTDHFLYTKQLLAHALK